MATLGPMQRLPFSAVGDRIAAWTQALIDPEGGLVFDIVIFTVGDYFPLMVQATEKRGNTADFEHLVTAAVAKLR